MILKDKVVIITGAGPGMGQAMCRGAGAEGAKVVVSARSVPAIEEIAQDIVSKGGEAIAVPCDVANTEQCHALAKAAIDKWGRIDGMVHSAYYHPDGGSIIDHSIDQVLQALDVIAVGGLRMAQAVVPQMKAQGKGSIVNISTLATRKPMPGEGGYAMAKSAVNQLTRQLAIELSGTGVRANTALMGWMDGVPLDGFFGSQGEAGAAMKSLPAGVSTSDGIRQALKNLSKA